MQDLGSLTRDWTWAMAAKPQNLTTRLQGNSLKKCFCFWYLFIFGCTGSSKDTTGHVVIFSCGVWNLVPGQGSNLGPLHWECRVLDTGPSQKSLRKCFTFVSSHPTFAAVEVFDLEPGHWVYTQWTDRKTKSPAPGHLPGWPLVGVCWLPSALGDPLNGSSWFSPLVRPAVPWNCFLAKLSLATPGGHWPS